MALKLYNSFTKKVEEFTPLKPHEVRMYSCGPTVYSYVHIGNYRTYVFQDLLRRTLEYFGYQTIHGINITDVGHLVGDEDGGEDKFDAVAAKEKKTPLEIAAFYEQKFFEDLPKLNIRKPDHVVRASDAIQEAVDIIERLLAKRYAYVTEQAIYFDTAQWEKYATLFGRQTSERKIGARDEVVVDPEKKRPEDFALWFFRIGRYKNHILHWPSPWGEGFPGWHIECSAISRKILGQPFDIHTGGIDLRETHHPNEVAQSEAAFQLPLARYWLHGEHLVTETKMSKSLGNIITPTELETQGYHPLSFRYLTLLTHYRQQLSFSFETLASAQKAYFHLIEVYFDLLEQSREHNSTPAALVAEFKEEIGNDLNFPAGLALLWETLKSKAYSPDEKIAFAQSADLVLGLNIHDKAQSLRVRPSDDMKNLLSERDAARKAGDFARADDIRAYFLTLGIEIRDLPTGPALRRSTN